MLDPGIFGANSSMKSLPVRLDKSSTLADAHLGVHVRLYANGEVPHSTGRNLHSSSIKHGIYLCDSNSHSKLYISESVYFFCKNQVQLEKIKPYIEKNTGDYQNGFRDGRSVINNIFTLKMLNEKIWEYNQSVQYLFIDFQKAYDSIHRDALWKCMEEFTIPIKLINMCKTCVQRQEVRFV